MRVVFSFSAVPSGETPVSVKPLVSGTKHRSLDTCSHVCLDSHAIANEGFRAEYFWLLVMVLYVTYLDHRRVVCTQVAHTCLT